MRNGKKVIAMKKLVTILLITGTMLFGNALNGEIDRRQFDLTQLSEPYMPTNDEQHPSIYAAIHGDINVLKSMRDEQAPEIVMPFLKSLVFPAFILAAEIGSLNLFVAALKATTLEEINSVRCDSPIIEEVPLLTFVFLVAAQHNHQNIFTFLFRNKTIRDTQVTTAYYKCTASEFALLMAAESGHLDIFSQLFAINTIRHAIIREIQDGSTIYKSVQHVAHRKALANHRDAIVNHIHTKLACERAALAARPTRECCIVM